jgi:hypothetical protein
MNVFHASTDFGVPIRTACASAGTTATRRHAANTWDFATLPL